METGSIADGAEEINARTAGFEACVDERRSGLDEPLLLDDELLERKLAELIAGLCDAGRGLGLRDQVLADTVKRVFSQLQALQGKPHVPLHRLLRKLRIELRFFQQSRRLLSRSLIAVEHGKLDPETVPQQPVGPRGGRGLFTRGLFVLETHEDIERGIGTCFGESQPRLRRDCVLPRGLQIGAGAGL